jgi:hypothetical protein
VFAFCNAGFTDGFEAGVHRLDEGGFLEGNVVGDGDHTALGNPGHGADEFCEAAAIWIEAGGEADFFIGGALGEKFLITVKTITAGDVVEADDAVAGFPFCYAGADCYRGAGDFVAEDLRRLDETVMDFFDVGAADAAGGYAD